jgi:hypothetical protein
MRAQTLMMSRWSSPMSDASYEVSFKGVASPTLRAGFVDYELRDEPGTTIVRCPQEALRTVMTLIEDFGLVLVEVNLL